MALHSPTGHGPRRCQQSHLLWRLEDEGDPPNGQHFEQSTLCSILPGRREDLRTDGKEVGKSPVGNSLVLGSRICPIRVLVKEHLLQR